MSESNGCSSLEQDLVLYLYDDLPADGRSAMEHHLGVCPRCRAEAAALKTTLAAVDRAGLPEWVVARGLPDWEDQWRCLQSRLEAARFSATPARFLWPALKAAAIVVLAGAAFAAGRQWDSVSEALHLPGSGDGGIRVSTTLPDDLRVPPDGASRLQLFSERTHGYLNRSRLVLLEFANAREAGDSRALREASANLLRETKSARRLAGKLDDPRIDELLGQLETILGEISRLSDPGDATTVDRIRTEVANSGLLDQLELLSSGPARLPQERS